jgi:hypothetical protein
MQSQPPKNNRTSFIDFRLIGSIFAKIAGTIGVTICSILVSEWLPNAKAEFTSYCESIDSCKPSPQEVPLILQVSKHHIFDLNSPVPYTSISLLCVMISTICDTKGSISKRKFKQVERELRDEKNEHGETRLNYNQAIEYILEFVFRSSAESWWDDSCRVSIYRHTGDGYLKRIYRLAEKSMYQNGGRIKIPDDEGVVGAAWRNAGKCFIQIGSPYGKTRYIADLRKELDQDGSKVPSHTTLTMPSCEFFAISIRNIFRDKIAIIVVESTNFGTITPIDIESIISKEASQIARFIQHKGKLDEILNPDCDQNNEQG